MKARKTTKKGDPRMPENRHKTGFRGPSPDVGKKTQFKLGESGNPRGRPKEKPILEALRETLEKEPKLLAEIAAAALKQAKYNLGWFGEVRDMLDGKPDVKPSGGSDDPVNFNFNVRFIDPAQNG